MLADVGGWLLIFLLILVAGLLTANLIFRSDKKLIVRQSATIFWADGSTETRAIGTSTSDDTEYLGTHRLDFGDGEVRAVKINTRATYQ